jgi:hypothetical protein
MFQIHFGIWINMHTTPMNRIRGTSQAQTLLRAAGNLSFVEPGTLFHAT